MINYSQETKQQPSLVASQIPWQFRNAPSVILCHMLKLAGTSDTGYLICMSLSHVICSGNGKKLAGAQNTQSNTLYSLFLTPDNTISTSGASTTSGLIHICQLALTSSTATCWKKSARPENVIFFRAHFFCRISLIAA